MASRVELARRVCLPIATSTQPRASWCTSTSNGSGVSGRSVNALSEIRSATAANEPAGSTYTWRSTITRATPSHNSAPHRPARCRGLARAHPRALRRTRHPGATHHERQRLLLRRPRPPPSRRQARPPTPPHPPLHTPHQRKSRSAGRHPATRMGLQPHLALKQPPRPRPTQLPTLAQHPPSPRHHRSPTHHPHLTGSGVLHLERLVDLARLDAAGADVGALRHAVHEDAH